MLIPSGPDARSGRTTLPVPEDVGPWLERAIRPGMVWGTERVEEVLAGVGNPHLAYRTVHVGGTNGKGSVATVIASVLGQAGVRTGLFTSPHLVSVLDTVQVDGRPVSPQAYSSAAASLRPRIERVRPTEFEALAAIAFQLLAEAGVETAVVEVGLGGRRDATGVILPEVVVVTNVGLDHAKHLGGSLESIARRKATLVRPGVPVVTATSPGPALDVLAGTARSLGSEFRTVSFRDLSGLRLGVDGTAFTIRTGGWGALELYTELIGAHQALNAALAVTALGMLPEPLRPPREAVVEGVRRARVAGRFQIVRREGGTWVFDVAHNPSAVSVVCETAEVLGLSRPLVAVVGILGDKDWGTMLERVGRTADDLVLTVPRSAPPGRVWDPIGVAAALPELGARAVPDLGAALRLGAELAGEAGPVGSSADAGRPGSGEPAGGTGPGTVLVTGSVRTVGDALIELGILP